MFGIDKQKIDLAVVVALIGYILLKPDFVTGVGNYLFSSTIENWFMIIIGIFIAWLLITKYDQTIGYLFLAALIVFVREKTSEKFVSGVEWKMQKKIDDILTKTGKTPEEVIDHRNLSYQKYVDETTDVEKAKDNLVDVVAYEPCEKEKVEEKTEVDKKDY